MNEFQDNNFIIKRPEEGGGKGVEMYKKEKNEEVRPGK